MLGKLWTLHHDSIKFDKRRPILLIELQLQIKCGTNVFSEAVTESIDASSNKFLTIILTTFLIKTCYIFHYSQLVKQQAHRKDITLVDIMLCKS